MRAALSVSRAGINKRLCCISILYAPRSPANYCYPPLADRFLLSCWAGSGISGGIRISSQLSSGVGFIESDVASFMNVALSFNSSIYVHIYIVSEAHLRLATIEGRTRDRASVDCRQLNIKYLRSQARITGINNNCSCRRIVS